MKSEAFTVKSEAFTVKSEAFPAKPEAFTVKFEAFTVKSEAFTVKSKAFTVKSGLPAGEFVWFVFSGQVEVQTELCVDSNTKIIIHLDNLKIKMFMRISTEIKC